MTNILTISAIRIMGSTTDTNSATSRENKDIFYISEMTLEMRNDFVFLDLGLLAHHVTITRTGTMGRRNFNPRIQSCHKDSKIAAKTMTGKSNPSIIHLGN